MIITTRNVFPRREVGKQSSRGFTRQADTQPNKKTPRQWVPRERARSPTRTKKTPTYVEPEKRPKLKDSRPFPTYHHTRQQQQEVSRDAIYLLLHRESTTTVTTCRSPLATRFPHAALDPDPQESMPRPLFAPLRLNGPCEREILSTTPSALFLEHFPEGHLLIVGKKKGSPRNRSRGLSNNRRPFSRKPRQTATLDSRKIGPYGTRNDTHHYQSKQGRRTKQHTCMVALASGHHAFLGNTTRMSSYCPIFKMTPANHLNNKRFEMVTTVPPPFPLRHSRPTICQHKTRFCLYTDFTRGKTKENNKKRKKKKHEGWPVPPETKEKSKTSWHTFPPQLTLS